MVVERYLQDEDTVILTDNLVCTRWDDGTQSQNHGWEDFSFEFVLCNHTMRISTEMK